MSPPSALPTWGVPDRADAAPAGVLQSAHEVKAPRVRVGHIVVTGALPPAEVEPVTRQRLGSIRLCYETALQKNGASGGLVVTRFVVDANGVASRAQSDPCTTVGDADLTACIAGVLSTTSFPASGGESSVVFPVTLEPAGK